MKLALPRAPLFGWDTQGAPSELGVFVPPDAVFPGTPSTEQALIDVLATLGRDDTLFQCARTNTLVSGPGDFEVKGRQQRRSAHSARRTDRINDFARGHPSSGAPTVFFRGQMLELMRMEAGSPAAEVAPVSR
jgi:hypothetical protein